MDAGMCRGAESNCLRRPFQGRALPVSYLGTGTTLDSTEIGDGAQSENGPGRRTAMLLARNGRCAKSAERFGA